MIGVAMFTTIKTLWEKHRNKAVIAELTGHDWKTISKVVKLIESGGKCLETQKTGSKNKNKNGVRIIF